MGAMPTRLPTILEVTVYRVVQEALSNAVKHSSARRVRITVLESHDAVVAEIADDGRGFTLDRIEPGFGLSTMRERALLLEGSVRISSRTTPPTGTMIQLRLPVEAQSASGEGAAAGRR
jgi:signal transduction histidine kinase